MRKRNGFTLIELLVTTVILAVLASIGIARFTTTVEKSTDAAAISDLRNAMSAEESYLIENQTYTPLSNLSLTISTGVTLGGGGSAAGYNLTAHHQSSGSTYQVSVGSGSSTEGRIVKQ